MSGDTHSGQGSSSEPPLPAPKHEHQEEGGEGWLVSYADMMTLLVGFFVILMSFSTVDQEKFEELKKSSAKEFGGKYQSEFGDVTVKLKEEISKFGLGDQVAVKELPDGIAISFLGAVFFSPGGADLKQEAVNLMAKLVPVIRAQSDGFNILVEGHTDDVPMSGHAEIQTNWELSGVRACRVLRSFEDVGLDKAHLVAIGYGDTRPVVPNRDEAGNPIPKNQDQNRRVVIKLLKRPAGLAGGGAKEPVDRSE